MWIRGSGRPPGQAQIEGDRVLEERGEESAMGILWSIWKKEDIMGIIFGKARNF